MTFSGCVRLVWVTLILVTAVNRCEGASPKLVYVKKSSRAATIIASLKASGLPDLQGKWHYLGPLDNTDNRGFNAEYPPEKEIDLLKTYTGKDDAKIRWNEFAKFRVGRVNDLKLFEKSAYCCVYLYHEIEVKDALTLPVSLGSDDTLTLWLNGDRLLAEDVHRPAAPD